MGFANEDALCKAASRLSAGGLAAADQAPLTQVVTINLDLA
jgi:hypothetical protein